MEPLIGARHGHHTPDARLSDNLLGCSRDETPATMPDNIDAPTPGLYADLPNPSRDDLGIVHRIAVSIDRQIDREQAEPVACQRPFDG